LDRSRPASRRFTPSPSTRSEATGLFPDFVLPAQLLARKVGLRHNQSALLRIARVVGWVAHAMEQFHERDLVRPHAAYAGELPAI
jgi:citrate synthase